MIKERSNYDKIYFSYLLTGQLDNSTEDAANLGLSCTVKLDGSCFVIDCNELSSVSSEAGQLWSSKVWLPVNFVRLLLLQGENS